MRTFLAICAAGLATATAILPLSETALLNAAVKARAEAFEHVETAAGRSLNELTEQQINDIKEVFNDVYNQYFAPCLGAYGIDQFVRCEAEVAFDLILELGFGGDYSALDEFEDQLNASLAALQSVSGAPTAQQCSDIFASEIVGCVALYLSGDDIVAFVNAGETGFQDNQQACQSLIILSGDDDTASQELSEEISQPLYEVAEGGEGAGRRLQSVDDSFEASEPEEGQTQEEAVNAAITGLNDVGEACQTVNPSIFSDIPDVPPPSSAGMLKATILLTISVLAIFS